MMGVVTKKRKNELETSPMGGRGWKRDHSKHQFGNFENPEKAETEVFIGRLDMINQLVNI